MALPTPSDVTVEAWTALGTLGSATPATNVFGISEPHADLPRVAGLIAETGIKWVRAEIYWSKVEAVEGVYNWELYDRMIQTYVDLGINVQAILSYMPDTSRFADWSEAATAFQAFASAAVARYAPLGVHYWEMFNEPNLTGYGWLPAAEVAADNLKGYLMLLAAGNVAVRANDPLGLVIIGGLAADDARGVTAETTMSLFYSLGGKNCFDIMAFHPYGYQGTFDTAKTRIAAILTAGSDTKPVWFNEYGWTGYDTMNLRTDPTLTTNQMIKAYSQRAEADALFWFSGTDYSRSWGTPTFGLASYWGAKRPSFATMQALTALVAPTLNAVSLSAATVTASAPAGTTVGTIVGKTIGSTLSLIDDAGGMFALSSGTIVVGLTALTNGVKSITIRETLAGATNTPRDTVLSVTVSATATAPSQFTGGMWTITDKATTKSAIIAITGLPSDGGSPLLDIQYQVNAGSWISAGRRGIGSFTILGLTNGASASVAIRAVNLVGNGAGSTAKSVTPTAGTPISTTAVTSVSYLGATYSFSKAVNVGYYAEGQPFVLSDTTFSITSISPAGTTVTTGTWNETVGSVSGASYDVNGAMVNPWIPSGASQGFSRFVGSHIKSGDPGQPSAKASQVVDYDPALNVDPGKTGSAYAVGIGDAKSIVKSIHAAGVTTPVQKMFDGFSVLHIVPEAPPAGHYAPAACDLDKTPYACVADRNLACLGSGFTLSSGMPSLATCISDAYINNSGFYPFFGPVGEKWRHFALDAFDYSGGAAGFASRWFDYIAAMQAKGSTVTDAEVNPVIALALGIIGWRRRAVANGDIASDGFLMPGGAGQRCGFGGMGFVAGFMFPSVPDALYQGQRIGGNAFNQPFWVGPERKGVPTGWPGVHTIYRQTWFDEHVGLPDWIVNPDDPDSQIASDYRSVSSLATFIEVMSVMLLKNGPDGIDGAQAAARRGAWGTSNPYAAALAYNDRLRTIKDVHDSTSYTQSKHIAFYDDHRTEASMPKWTGVPDQFMPRPYDMGPYLWPLANGFGWNLSAAEHATETILEYKIQYSLDGLQFVDVTTQGASGTQTGLIGAQLYFIRWKRRSASGWGPWSMNFNQQVNGPYLTITTTGSRSGAVTNAAAPKLLTKKYPLWKGVYFEDAATAAPLGTPIYVGFGMWTGNLSGTATYAGKTAATAGGTYATGAGTVVADSIGSFYDSAAADADQYLKVELTQDGVTVTTAPVQLGDLPAIPADTIIDTEFGYNFKLLYPDVWASFVAESYHVSSLTHLPDFTLYSTPVDEDDPVTLVASGILLGEKNGSYPGLIGKIGTDRPLTIGQTYELTVTAASDVPMLSGSVRIWTGPLKWRVGTTKNGVDYETATIPVDTHPMQITLTKTFVATATTVWVGAEATTGSGGTAGGNPALNSLKVVKL